MDMIQSTGRAVRKNRKAFGRSGGLGTFGTFGTLGMLIAALVLASALLAACETGTSSAGADTPQEGGSTSSAVAPQAAGGTEEPGEADPPDGSTASPSSSAGGDADGEELTWTDGKLIKPDGESIGDASFLFAADQGGIFTVHGDFNVIDRDGKPLNASSLKAGALIRVEYGLALESYPGQISPRTVQVMDEGDDMVGLYISMLDKVWNEDPGLNPRSDGMLAVDVEDIGNLTDGEKNALVWLAGSRFEIQSFASTFEKLKEEGYLDGLQFKDENGMLIEVSTSDEKKDSFKFKISKWVSGDGADWYDDCTASKTGGAWDFELGGFAVS
jgi:predicted small secreted protein